HVPTCYYTGQMPCPYFYPVARFESGSWVIPPRLPLGDQYSGECRAGADAFQPEEKKMREVCNLGYGRGRCDRFPDTSPAAAVRFHVSKDAGDLIHIQYVLEKDCWPRRHGILEYSSAAADVSTGTSDPILRRQASAFAESYLRRRG